MKFLCVAEHIDSFVFSQLIKERFPDIDAVLCAGDVPLEYIDYLAAAFEKPVLCVAGNHHFYTETEQAPKAQAVDFCCVKKNYRRKNNAHSGRVWIVPPQRSPRAIHGRANVFAPARAHAVSFVEQSPLRQIP
jgi:hypothetical protein